MEDVSWECLISFGSLKSLTKYKNSGHQFFEISKTLKALKLGFRKQSILILGASGLL